MSGWNFADDNAQLYSPADEDDHGTHVAGTIAARRDNAIGVAGVADNARIMALKFLKPEGGYTSDAMQAIDYAVDHGAKVINASWGGSVLLPAAVRHGAARRPTRACSSSPPPATSTSTTTQSQSWPANCPASSLVSVAATNSADDLASFSNYGASTVDVGAPGEMVRSLAPGDGYAYMSGTSMAAPHVSGVAAVLLGEAPGLAPWQVKAAITLGGDAIPSMAGTTAERPPAEPERRPRRRARPA